jgi:hypothetical protein
MLFIYALIILTLGILIKKDLLHIEKAFLERLALLKDAFFPKRAQNLLSAINQELYSLGEDSTISFEQEEVEYKFFFHLFEQALFSARQWGTPKREILREVKKALAIDQKCERKILKEKKSFLIQLLFLYILFWVFTLFAFHTLSFTLPLKYVFLILISQAFGVFLFFIFFYKIQRKVFGKISLYFEALFKIKAGLLGGMSISRAIENSPISEVSADRSPPDSYIQKRLCLLVENIKSSGVRPFEELDFLIERLIEIWDFLFDSTLRYLFTLKLFFFVIFLLGPYFGVLFWIIDIFLRKI